MNGTTSLRGYLLQTIICLFDALETTDIKWDSVVIEPNLLSEKVDIAWFYSEQKKVVQVKSSQNQIGLSRVKQWAEDLENAIQADEYKLVLLGPCSQSVVDLEKVGSVNIPPPKNNDVRGLMEQASHKLDIYLESRGYHLTSASERELMVASLVLRLEEYSTMSLRIQKSEFDTLIREWRSVIYSKRKTGIDELDLMEYRKNKNFEEAAKTFNVSISRLQDILAVMPPRFSFIIEAKFGLIPNGEKLTTEEIADLFMAPTWRIKELEEGALEQLKQNIKKHRLNILATFGKKRSMKKPPAD